MMGPYKTWAGTQTAKQRAIAASTAPPPIVPVDTLAALLDVNVAGVADGQSLVYELLSAKWKPGAPSGGGSLATLSDVNLVGVTDGNLLAYDGASGKWVNGAVIQLDGPF